MPDIGARAIVCISVQQNEIDDENGCDYHEINGDHSQVCQLNNGINPENAGGFDDNCDTKIEGISWQYKNRYTDLALEKFGYNH